MTKPLATCRIFYLEDDYFLAEETKETLVAAGAEVSLCANVPQALDLVHCHNFDAALLDIDLAGKSSVPVARELRQADTPVVFLTGCTPDVLPDDLSSCTVLAKPSHGSTVVRELEQQLQLTGAHKGHAGCNRSPSDDGENPKK